MFANIRLSSSILGLAALANVWTAVALTAAQRCQGTTVSTKMIGMNNDVEIETVLCANRHDSFMTQSGNSNSNNVCNATCNTNCFPSGEGPDPNDCQILAEAVLYDSEYYGDEFFAPTSLTPDFIVRYKSCKAFFINQSKNNLTYCYTSMANAITSLASNCQNTHGGNCVAGDERWYVHFEARS